MSYVTAAEAVFGFELDYETEEHHRNAINAQNGCMDEENWFFSADDSRSGPPACVFGVSLGGGVDDTGVGEFDPRKADGMEQVIRDKAAKIGLTLPNAPPRFLLAVHVR